MCDQCLVGILQAGCKVIYAKQMNFSEALVELKANKKLTRTGWNGKNMWVYLVPGSTFPVAEGRPLASFLPVGQEVNYRPHVDLLAADGTLGVWTVSQNDLLAEDWEVVA